MVPSNNELMLSPDRDRMKALIAPVLAGCNKVTARIYAPQMMSLVEWLRAEGRPFERMAIESWLAESEATPGMHNLRVQAAKRLARFAHQCGQLDDEAYRQIRMVEGKKIRGRTTGSWLTMAQASALVNAPERTTLRGCRDAAVFALVLGCGLRRDEVGHVTVEHLKDIEGRPCIVDLMGKGNRIRTVPVSEWAAKLIFDYIQLAMIPDGRIVPLSGEWIRQLFIKYGRVIGVDIRPHDGRRTFANLSLKGGADIRQVQANLGHASLSTTEKYLNMHLAVAKGEACGDKIRLEVI